MQVPMCYEITGQAAYSPLSDWFPAYFADPAMFIENNSPCSVYNTLMRGIKQSQTSDLPFADASRCSSCTTTWDSEWPISKPSALIYHLSHYSLLYPPKFSRLPPYLCCLSRLLSLIHVSEVNYSKDSCNAYRYAVVSSPFLALESFGLLYMILMSIGCRERRLLDYLLINALYIIHEWYPINWARTDRSVGHLEQYKFYQEFRSFNLREWRNLDAGHWGGGTSQNFFGNQRFCTAI